MMTTETAPLYSNNKSVGDMPSHVRSGFIQKVYGILSAQLIVTAAVAAPFVLSHSVKAWVRQHPPFIMCVAVLNMLMMCVLVCPCGCEKNLRRFPQNFLLLFGFTMTEGVLVGVVCSAYTMTSVFYAVSATGFLVLGLSLFAVTTKSDFTGMGGYLFAGCLVMMLFGFLMMFVHVPFMKTLYCCFGVLLFSFYLIFDTQMIMGNKGLCIGIDDYIFAALQLYIDIIQLFLYILQLLGEKN